MDVAWVTGGGTGIGRALAERLAARGLAVLITGRRSEPLEQTAKEFAVRFPHSPVIPLPGNVADPALGARALAAAAPLGPITLLINNAGRTVIRPFEEAPADEVLELFRDNCLGAILCTKAVLPGMRAHGRGAIVNISSILGRFASSNSAAYSISKYALTGFTDVLRQELIHSPIHVLGVYPGFIRTALTRPFVKEGSLRERMGKSPEDLAAAILRALDRRRSELFFPWYVAWSIRFHNAFPRLADRFARRVRG